MASDYSANQILHPDGVRLQCKSGNQILAPSGRESRTDVVSYQRERRVPVAGQISSSLINGQIKEARTYVLSQCDLTE
jgi:hypothetical protein